MRKIWIYSTAILLAGLFTAGFSGEKQSPAKKAAEKTKAVEKEIREIVISPVGDQMKYALTEFTVKTGEKVRITLKNVAKLQGMNHNVVICKPGTDTDAVGIAGLQVGLEKNYVAEREDVLFHTEVALPGESKSIEFIAPAPGEYPYICTFPGHWTLMKGVMKVVE